MIPWYQKILSIYNGTMVPCLMTKLRDAGYEKIIEEILAIDAVVRYVGVVDNRGSLVYSKLKEGKKSLKTQKEEEVFAADLSVMKLMQELFNDSLGRVTLVHTVREKLHQLVYYIDSFMIYVTCERNIDNHTATEISDKIESILKNTLKIWT